MKAPALVTAAWWKGTDTPRWVLALGAALSIAIGLFGSLLLQDEARVDENRAQQIQGLLDSMVQFQVFATAFSTEMFEDETVSVETRTELLKNLNDQFARGKTLTQIIPEEQDSVQRYLDAVTRMVEATHKAHDINSMKDFWSAASALTVERNALNPELREYI